MEAEMTFTRTEVVTFEPDALGTAVFKIEWTEGKDKGGDEMPGSFTLHCITDGMDYMCIVQTSEFRRALELLEMTGE